MTDAFNFISACFLGSVTSGSGLDAGDPPALAMTGRLWAVVGVYVLLLLAGTLVDLVVGWRWLRNPPEWHQPIRCLRKRPWPWLVVCRIALGLVLVQCLMLVVLRGAMHWGYVTASGPEAWHALLQGVTFHGFALVLILASLWRRRISCSRAFGLSADRLGLRLGQGILAYAGILPPVVVGAVLFPWWLFGMGVPPSMQDVVNVFLNTKSPFMLAALVVLAFGVAPLVEEMLFRGILLPAITARWNATAGIVISSILFALLHFHLPSFMPLFLLAVGFSLLYIYTRSLWVPVIMHALFNGLNVLLLYSIMP